jgi:hypothetical protein
MAEEMNLLRPWADLTEKERRFAEAFGLRSLSKRQPAIEKLLKASREYRASGLWWSWRRRNEATRKYRAACATIAGKLKGPPADQLD